VHSKTKPVLAKAIETTPDALILIMEDRSVSIPWEKCSERLAHASGIERNRAELSPSGYGIHWPLIDEDLAVGPLLRGIAELAVDRKTALEYSIRGSMILPRDTSGNSRCGV
jgi:hypothetical protein